ncbi:hypothetical protein HDU90_002645 [Geranomyces variabilis]|nr:hypothetical protein HDU90_002645 [Geranomyces variabilis]
MSAPQPPRELDPAAGAPAVGPNAAYFPGKYRLPSATTSAQAPPIPAAVASQVPALTATNTKASAVAVANTRTQTTVPPEVSESKENLQYAPRDFTKSYASQQQRKPAPFEYRPSKAFHPPYMQKPQPRPSDSRQNSSVQSRGGYVPPPNVSNQTSGSRYRSPHDQYQPHGQSFRLDPSMPPKVLSSSDRQNFSQDASRYAPQYHPAYSMPQMHQNRSQLMQNALNRYQPDLATRGGPGEPAGVPQSQTFRGGLPAMAYYTPVERYDSAPISRDTAQELRELLSAIPEDDVTVDAEHQPKEVTVTLMPHQLKGVAWMKSREAGSNAGGILADDMGLGKTVQTISLIVASRSEDAACKTTLIVAPLALINQWEQEILTKTKQGTLKVLLYHGNARPKDPKKLMSYDVVITTFSLIASECPKQPKSKKNDTADELKLPKEAGPLFKVKWFRVVLDEAQTIKNKTTKSALGCCALLARRRFCLSGTPIQNNIDELYSLLKFLQFAPFQDYAIFKSQIAEPLSRGRTKQAMERLRAILQAIMLRRTKVTMIDGKPLLVLPARNVDLVTIRFGPADMAYYTQLETKMRDKVKEMKKDGGNNYTNYLCMLLRLRQACNHRGLVGAGADKESEISPAKPAAGEEDEDDVDEMAAMFRTLEVDAHNRKCTICFDLLVDVPEHQKQCDDCASKFVQSEAVKMGPLASVIGGRGGKKNSALVKELTSDWVSSAKIDKTMELLNTVRTAEPTVKTILFSQFTSMLDIMEIPLRAQGHLFVRYDGSMPNAERERSLDAVRNDPRVTVLLISLKCGSLGLNLTAASRVVMLDMWWNPALEDQAIDRVHRIGQTRDVEVTRFVVKGTVEDRILALQQKKRALIEGALGDATFRKAKKMTTDELLALFG